MTQSAIKARLITNPRSGRGGVDLSEPLSILREQGWDVSVRQKLHGGHATELAREAARDGCHVVVDCGGDGTLNELVEGVLGTETAVGVLPGGTANVWAHEVGVASRLQMAAMQLVASERRRVDVGEVTVNGKHKNHFVLMAGVGLDGAIIDHVSKPLKNRIGPAAIGLATLQALPEARAVPVRVELDDLHWRGRVSEIIISNTRRYAGMTNLTANAFADDGLFDVCLITATGPLSAGRLLGSLLCQRQPSSDVAQFYRASHVRIAAPVTLPLQVDGGSVKLKHEKPTPAGTIYEFSILARAVTMLVPKTYSGELFKPARLATISPEPELEPVPAKGAAAASKAATSVEPLESAESAEAGEAGEAGEPVSVERKASKGGKGGQKGKRWRVTALEVGVESLTAARVKNGRVMRFSISPDTTFDDGSGQSQSLLSTLSRVTAGDLLRVTGRKEGDGHAARAIHVERVAQSAPASAGSVQN
ncbi:MAG TPA: diacylglycerol kinase family protein [Ktedonobacterales bacterium]|nr:diacylglycerol kinase family protein [Ktedonobacterales bacterium]